MKKVTLLIPCYNEESSLPALHAALCEVMDSQVQYQWEVLLIDDGSRDQSLSVMRQCVARTHGWPSSASHAILARRMPC